MKILYPNLIVCQTSSLSNFDTQMTLSDVRWLGGPKLNLAAMLRFMIEITVVPPSTSSLQLLLSPTCAVKVPLNWRDRNSRRTEWLRHYLKGWSFYDFGTSNNDGSIGRRECRALIGELTILNLCSKWNHFCTFDSQRSSTFSRLIYIHLHSPR